MLNPGRARFRRTHHHVREAGNRAPHLARDKNGCRTPAWRDHIQLPDQDAALFVRPLASQPLVHPRRAGADSDDVLFVA